MIADRLDRRGGLQLRPQPGRATSQKRKPLRARSIGVLARRRPGGDLRHRFSDEADSTPHAKPTPICGAAASPVRSPRSELPRAAFEEAGFHGIRILESARADAWQYGRRHRVPLGHRSKRSSGKEGPLPRTDAGGDLSRDRSRRLLDDDGHRTRTRASATPSATRRSASTRRRPISESVRARSSRGEEVPIDEAGDRSTAPGDRLAVDPSETKGAGLRPHFRVPPRTLLRTGRLLLMATVARSGRRSIVPSTARPESAVDAPPSRCARRVGHHSGFRLRGTVCNLACTHCFITCSPTNHGPMSSSVARDAIRPVPRAEGVGTRE